MSNTSYIAWAIVILLIVIYFIFRNSPDEEEDENASYKIDIRAKEPNGREIERIKTYFFTKNEFDFKKYLDYILCINGNLDIEEMSTCILELHLFLECSPELKNRMLQILMFSEGIIGINAEDFDELKDFIREGVFKGAYADVTYITICAIFYLKWQITEKISMRNK